jgi:hypothetical protein
VDAGSGSLRGSGGGLDGLYGLRGRGGLSGAVRGAVAQGSWWAGVMAVSYDLFGPGLPWKAVSYDLFGPGLPWKARRGPRRTTRRCR